MKLGIAIIAHYSVAYRSNGIELVKSSVESLIKNLRSDIDYHIIVVDNGSDIKLAEVIEYDGVKVLRIDDQTIGGITYAMNCGLSMLFDIGCDIAVIANDDLTYNLTVNNLYDEICSDTLSDHSFYGVMTNKSVVAKQVSKGVINKNIVLSGAIDDVINTFLFAITKECYNSYKHGNVLILTNHKYNGGDGKWGGQEGMQCIWADAGMRLVVIGSCWVDHVKIRGWKQLRKK